MKFHDVDQNSEEWYNLRYGRVTISNFGKIMANYGAAFGEPAKKYAFKVAYEGIMKQPIDEDQYTNKHMENGHIYEPVACEAYEYKTFNEVSNGGFCISDKYDQVGGSPDGLILDQNGGIEIKSVIPYTQRKTLHRNKFDPAYKWQILGQIWLCDLDWVDFVSYGFRSSEHKKLFINRVERKAFAEDLHKIDQRLPDFLKLVELNKKYV